MKLEGKVVIAQGGGPTAVINQSLVGVVLESRKFAQVSRVYGAVNGVTGILNEDFVDLTQETTHNLEQVAVTPSSALFSTREKPDEKFCKEMFRVMKAHDVRYFFYIGGNDSADTVRIVNEQAKKVRYEFRAIHIPKTIDNDLVLNDHPHMLPPL
jgi:6-phosphofructokinase 1